MNDNPALSASIVMPIYNGASTLEEVFKYLERQRNKHLIKKLILVNDRSTDRSAEIIDNYANRSSYNCHVIHNKTNIGLAEGYNLGAKTADAPLLITMHQDMLLTDDDSIKKITQPFAQDATVAAAHPVVLHPMGIWKSYGFWQKAMFSRFVEKETPLLTGKFDCFSTDTLNRLGGFDSKTHRTAGEDGDIKRKIDNLGLNMVNSGLKVVHIHNMESNFGLSKYVKKENQIAEGQGVLLRKYGPQGIINVVAAFFRPILVFGLLVPYINIMTVVLILIYSLAYVWNLYRFKVKDIRLLLLPVINIYILFSASYYSFKGFVLKRQTL